jgi:hypothetical protein
MCTCVSTAGVQLMQPPEVSIVQAMLDRVEQAAPRRGHKTGPERGAARAKKSKQLESYMSKVSAGNVPAPCMPMTTV